MAKRLKVVECRCGACARFNVNAVALMESIGTLRKIDPELLKKIGQDLLLGKGCDLCGRDETRIAFVPQIIKEFFHIEFLCELCRSAINRIRYKKSWPVCWSATPDDEIKWFLVGFVFEWFNDSIRQVQTEQLR